MNTLNKSETTEWLPVASLLLAMLLWGSSFVALKLAFTEYDPMVVIFGRMFIASLCFAVFIPSFLKIQLRRQDIKYLVFMAACEPCLYFIFEAKALQNTTASQAGMITAILPLLVAVLACSFLKESVNRNTIYGFLLAIAGAVWLSLAGESSVHAPAPLLGNFYEFMAMVCAAGYTITLKHLSRGYPALFLTAIQAFIGSLFFFPFLCLQQTQLPQAFYPAPALAVVYLGVCITLGAYGLYNYGVSQIPASRAAAYVNLIPAFSVILGMLVLDESMTFSQCLACGLVFLGVFLSRSQGNEAGNALPTTE